jgi:hypothetical protein
MSAGTPTAATDDRLSYTERLVALAISLVAGVGAWRLAFHPPHINQASSSCMSASCVVKVSATEQTVVVALIALAAAASLIAVLGVRFTKLSAAGASLEQPTVSEVDPKKAAERTAGALTDQAPQAPSRSLDLDPAQAVHPPAPALSDDEWNKLPQWAQNALVAWAENVATVTQPMRFAVIEAAKEQGRGNHPWYVKVKLDDDSVRTLRIGTGRGGTATEDA